MTDPMEQFKVIFFEECSELLTSLEEGLMEYQVGGGVEETINSIFRAVHTIKGGAGAIGYTQLMAFTHIQETLLDQMRTGNLKMEPEYVDVLLQAFDILTELVGAAQRQVEVDEGYGAEVAHAMQSIINQQGQKTPETSPETSPETPSVQTPKQTTEQKKYLFKILFKPHVELYQRANEPILLIRELEALGKLEVKLDTSELPAIEHMDAEHAYFAWGFRLVTEYTEDDILEVFEFVEADCDLVIASHGVYLPEDECSLDDKQDQIEISQATADDGPGPGEALSPEIIQKTVQKTPKTEETLVTRSIRVELDKVDRLVNMIGELVITQAMLREQGSKLLVEQYPNLVQGIEELSRHIRDLQESVMAIRAEPVKSVFSRMPRLVRELTASLDKKARLVMTGEETEVDKTVTERIGDPLMHMIRNSVDHGLEMPEDRLAAGKNEEGVIHLSAFHRGGRIFIEIEDDGAGINREVVLKKAIANGLIAPDATLTDDEINNLIFLPGFSTAKSVTKVSGRGVGMDVVRKNIQSLGGRITISSIPGQGSKFTMSLPLTLAVMDGMVVTIGPQKYVLPLVNIIQTLRPEEEEINTLPDGRNVMMFREEYIFLVPLYDVFGVENAIHNPCEGLVVVVEGDGGLLMGFIVDDLVNQQQVVIKSLETNYELIEGISGATILGNGLVSLIIDIATVQEMSARRHAHAQVLNHVQDLNQAVETSLSQAQHSAELH